MIRRVAVLWFFAFVCGSRFSRDTDLVRLQFNPWNDDLHYVESIFGDIEGLVMDASNMQYTMVMIGDFGLHLNEGDRGYIMQDFCNEISMNIASRDTLCDDAVKSTLENSLGNFRRLHYTLHSSSFRSFEVSVNESTINCILDPIIGIFQPLLHIYIQ